jgi:putative membrane protein (TIGR04086 family)
VGPVVKQETAIDLRLVITSLFSGLKYAIALLLITILLLAVTYGLGWDWSAYEHTIYQYSIYAAIMLGALATGYKAKVKGWLMGILLAVVVWLLFFIVGRIIGLEQDISKGLINGGIAILLGIVGGVIGINL